MRIEKATAMDAQRIEGYLHQNYASAFNEFGEPRELTRAGAWILKRKIPETDLSDGMGCYPIFCCQNWTNLSADLNEIGDLVSLVVLTDPFGDFDLDLLKRCFPDLTREFKQHYVTDLTREPLEFIASHHLRNVNRSIAVVDVERCENPVDHAGSWISLYDQLIQRHGIVGFSKFSPVSLRKQLEVPGVHAFRALVEGQTVGMVLWMVKDDVAYYHLAAYNDLGYQTRASYALFWRSIAEFASSGYHWMDLGAGAGLGEKEDNGLTRFKKGWATDSKTAYLCGRILNVEAYERQTFRCSHAARTYFPSYRYGEFGSV